MKIIHTADWHIGNTFYGYDRSDEHRHFLDFLLHTISEHEADALVVAGDVFDNPNPSAEAQRIYFDFLSRAVGENPGLQIVVIAGNHDSAARLEASAPILAPQGIQVRGCLHTDDKGNAKTEDLIIPLHSRKDPNDEVVCLAVPFLRQPEPPREDTFSKSMGKFFQELISKARRNYGKKQHMMLVAHFYATGSEISSEENSERIIIGGEENVDASKFCADLSYVALGHIHKAQRVAGLDHARYSGSALPMSFGERGYRHGVNVVNFGADGTVTLNPVEYTPLRKLVTIPQSGTATPDEAIEQAKSLPKCEKKDDNSSYPYVEVRLGKTPDSATLHSIKEAFDGRAAMLCTIRNVGNAEADNERPETETKEQLHQLDPLLMVKAIYKNRYGGEEMPQALVDKFNAALRIAKENEDYE